MSSNGYVVTATDLTRTYGEGEALVNALQGVSLGVKPGELVAVMGASGSGKSTLMHLLAALDKPTSGSIHIAGQDVGSLSDREVTLLRRKHIGFVFQFFNLLPMLTAEENVLLPLSIAGEKPDPEFFEDLVKRVGLGDRRSHRPSELSGGQQQRVAIARALVSKPTVVFADEPTGNLDSRTSEEVMAIFQELNEQGETVLLITHEPDIAHYAKRNIVLRDGKIVTDEPVKQVRAVAQKPAATGAKA
jgi:putative ABC transport system ATP-binding protein